MRRNTLSLLVLGALVLLPVMASAEHLEHERAGIRFWIPDEWDAEFEGDVMRLEQPEGDVVVIFDMLKASRLDDAIDELFDNLEEEFESLEMDRKPTKHERHGLLGYTFHGEGMAEDGEVDIAVLLLETPSKRVLLALAYVDSDRHDRYQDTVAKIFDSAKPIDD